MRRSTAPGAAAPAARGLPPAARAALGAGGGYPLDLRVRSEMESRFGQDLGRVRIHADPRAGEAADSLNALAFTLGESIWFGPGQYQPGTRSGRRLLAHELAHAVQQRQGGGVPQAQPKVGDVRDPAEAAADRAADAVMRGEPVPSLGAGAPVLRRQPRVVDPGTEQAAALAQTPQVTGTDDPDKVDVEYQRQRYGARQRVTGWREECKPEEVDEPARLKADFDRTNAWAQVEWCSAGGAGGNSTRGRIRLGADIPAALAQAVSGIVRGGTDPREQLKKLDLTPFVQVDIAKGQVSVTGKAQTTVNPASGEVRSGGGSIGLAVPGAVIEFKVDVTQGPGGRPEVRGGLVLTIPIGKQPPKVECRKVQVCRYQPQYAVECEQVTGGELVPAPPRTQFLYFEYENDTVATRNTRATGRHRQENLRGAAENDRETAEIARLLDDGWKVSAIEGYTSPEGPEQQEREGGFIGNEALSRKRAEAAQAFVAFQCNPALAMRRRACFVERPTVEGKGELLTGKNPRTGRELTGTPLVTQATPRFLESPDEARHRTPALDQQLRRAGPQEQATLMWPLLRRAKITFTRMERSPVRRERLEKCPASVETAVRAFFEARRERGRGGRP